MLMSLLIFNGNDANNACIYVVSPLPQRTLSSSSLFETIWQSTGTREWRGTKAPGSRARVAERWDEAGLGLVLVDPA